jgi:hypothetical protein
VIANVTIARELAGWCWSLAVLEEQPTLTGIVEQPGGSSAWTDPRSSYEHPLHDGHARV